MKRKLINKRNVLVIFGGISVEHDVSIITGIQTINNLDSLKYNIYPIYISKNGDWLYSKKFSRIETFTEEQKILKESKVVCVSPDGILNIRKGSKFINLTKIDFVYLCTHGGNGENGSLQGYLDMCRITYSSSGVLASSVGMNKFITKNVLNCLSIENTKFIHFSIAEFQKSREEILKRINTLNFPLIVKPSSLGSSVGIKYCSSNAELKNAISFACLFDDTILVEECVENLKEVNIAVMGNSINCECSDIEEVIKTNDILSFENKYLDNESAKGMESTKRILPAKLSQNMVDKIKSYAVSLFKSINCKGIVRIDFLINTKENKVYLNEINTIPGSMANYLWKTKKYSFSEMLDKIMEYALQDTVLKQKKVSNFSSNILSKFKNSNSLKLLK